jgi:hypothetical protein
LCMVSMDVGLTKFNWIEYRPRAPASGRASGLKVGPTAAQLQL